MQRIVLRETRDATGVRYLEVRREPNGAVVIEGQDLGDGVEAVFGEGVREYEWWWRLAPEDTVVAAETLGGEPGEDLLQVVARWFTAGGGHDPGSHLREAGVPIAFDSRVGD